MMAWGNDGPPLRTTADPVGKPVAVRLDLDGLYPHPADAPQTSVAEGWDLTGPIPALALAGTWVRSARGMWLVKCSFTIRSADGRQTLRLGDQLVPAHLLRVID